MEEIKSDSEKNDSLSGFDNMTPEENETAEQEPVLLGHTKDGAAVYDRIDSHFHSEGGMTPELLASALERIDTEDRGFLLEQVEFDHEIGTQTCVDIGPDDDVVMVYRKGRSGRTPMVKNREAAPCSSIVAILAKDRDYDDGCYVLVTGYTGALAPREPWDPGIEDEEERQRCDDFWSSHALLYNEDLIDQERMEMFDNMTDDEKRAELIRQQVLYEGLFVNKDELHQKIQPRLEKPIERPHVTTFYRPNETRQLNLDSLGSGARIIAIGYGNDGKNEGLLVRVEADDPAIQEACDALETPHITLSVSRDGRPVNTAYLDFTPLEEPFEITGNYGLYIRGNVITNSNDL